MRRASISRSLRRQVFTDFRYRCAYCHSPENLLNNFYELDHIVPVAAGGETNRENLCLACPVCNTYKSDAQWGVDPQTQERVRLFHPRRQHWNRHFAWAANNVTLFGRTRCGRATIVAYQLNNERLIRMRDFWLRLGARSPDWILPEDTDVA